MHFKFVLHGVVQHPYRSTIYGRLQWHERCRGITKGVFMSTQFERVLSKLFLTKPNTLDACWLWTGATGSAGYGQLKIILPGGRRQTRSIHTWLYERLVGKLKPGLELDHAVCQNKLCCNPSHLEPVTHAENCRRRELTNGYKHKASYIKATSDAAKRMWMLRKGLTIPTKSSVLSQIEAALHNT